MKRFVLLGMATLAVASTTEAAGVAGTAAAATRATAAGSMQGAARQEAVSATSPQAYPAAVPEEVPQDSTQSTTADANSAKKVAKKMKDAPASAPAPKTIYLSIGGGIDIPTRNTSISLPSAGGIFSPTAAGSGIFFLPRVHWQNKYQTGYDVNVAIGNKFTANTRIEAEFLYQNIKRKVSGNYNFEEFSVISGDTFASSFNNPIGETTTRSKVYSLLANGYYDFNNKSHWTPSLGAGIGVAWIRSPKTTFLGTYNVTDSTTGTVTPLPVVANSPALSGAAFAYQLKAGLSYELTKRAALALQYRYFGTSEFQGSSSSVKIGGGIFRVGQQNTSSLRTNSVELTYRYLVW